MYADVNTPYRTANTIIGNTIKEVIQSLEQGFMMFFKWFSDNQMKTNVIEKSELVRV